MKALKIIIQSIIFLFTPAVSVYLFYPKLEGISPLSWAFAIWSIVLICCTSFLFVNLSISFGKWFDTKFMRYVLDRQEKSLKRKEEKVVKLRNKLLGY